MIDETDRLIINLLRKNARMSAVEMSRQLGEEISPRVVRYRIEKLVEEGVISFTTVLDTRALGFPIQADILIRCEAGKVPEVAQRLVEYELVTYVSVVTGDQDISISIATRSVDELQRFLLEEIQTMPGIRQTQTYIVLDVLKQSHQWQIPTDFNE